MHDRRETINNFEVEHRRVHGKIVGGYPCMCNCFLEVPELGSIHFRDMYRQVRSRGSIHCRNMYRRVLFHDSKR